MKMEEWDKLDSASQIKKYFENDTGWYRMLQDYLAGSLKIIYISARSNQQLYTGELKGFKIKPNPSYQTPTELSWLEAFIQVGFDNKKYRTRWITLSNVTSFSETGPIIYPLKAKKIEQSDIIDFFGQPLAVGDYVACSDRRSCCFGTIVKFNPKSATIKITYRLQEKNFKTGYEKYKPYSEFFKVSDEIKGQLLLMDLGMNPRGK